MTGTDSTDDNASIPGIDLDVPPSGAGCVACDAEQPAGWWFHLRRCAACGAIGCCDSSPGQHATAHARASGHRYMSSYEPGEDWFYDYVDDEVLQGPRLAPPLSHPTDQPTPGPAGRVPDDWESRVLG